MSFEIDSTSEYKAWFAKQEEEVKKRIYALVTVLGERGPALKRPYVGTIEESAFTNMKELIVQVAGRPYRIFFIFGTNRIGLLLIGSVKDGEGDKDFYTRMIPQADKLVKKYKWK
jgi:hypothetical protein